MFFDAHDSHWDSGALRLWTDDRLFPLFLKAHGSDDDNFNDNGPNAKFHAMFDEDLTLTLTTIVTMTLTLTLTLTLNLTLTVTLMPTLTLGHC